MSTSQRVSLGFQPLGLLASPAFSFVKRSLAGIVLTLMLTSGVAAGPFEDGGAALKRGDYAEALRLWRPLADQGHADGQLKLGNMYGRGQGVPQDDAEAVKWYRLAAEQGNALAQFNLGIMYRRGQGVPQDYAEAVKWNRLAAEQGDAEAQHNLGVSYHRGEGVPQDYVQAHMWFNLAASRAPASERDEAIKMRNVAASNMTPEQIAEAQKLAREWRPK
jgi:TPR repeat protein